MAQATDSVIKYITNMDYVAVLTKKSYRYVVLYVLQRIKVLTYLLWLFRKSTKTLYDVRRQQDVAAGKTSFLTWI
jgi:hypothetical protein